MGDAFTVNYKIGGKIKDIDLPGLAMAILEGGLGIDDEVLSAEEVKNITKDCSSERDSLELYGSQVPSAETTELDDFCIAHGLAFVKAVQGDMDYNGEFLWWKPGMENISSWGHADIQATYPMMSVEDLKERFAMGKTLVDVIDELEIMIPDVGPIEITEVS